MQFNAMKTIQIIFSFLSCLTMLFLFIIILFNFKSLPQEIGIHFDSHGQYDVTGPKLQLLNYIPISVITIIVFELFQQLVKSLKIKDNISEDGEKLMRLVAASFVGVIELDVSVFILIVGYCIATQSPLKTLFMVACALVLITSIVLVAAVTFYITIKYAKPINKTN